MTLENNGPSRICKLPDHVIAKIAAGEIIQRPCNAVKELIENAIDAGCTSITLSIKEGGLKLLQIQDNGLGILQQDLPLLCQRFTTSKLRTFDDLTGIATFGFRGEALSSISHISRLSVTTKTSQSPCAYKAIYTDGTLTSAIPIAGNQGTIISASDLFWSLPTRRRMFKNPNEELLRITDIVGKYALHYAGKIAMCCKKLAPSGSGVSSTPIHTHLSQTPLEVLASIYGEDLSKNLIEWTYTGSKWDFNLHSFCSNPNYHDSSKGSGKASQSFILLINHRVVENAGIRKAIHTVYLPFMPKGVHPFVYVALELPAETIDVNIHPAKQEVCFLHEDEIRQEICTALELQLQQCNVSRTLDSFKGSSSSKQFFSDQPIVRHLTKVMSFKAAPSSQVRTDSQERTLHSFFKPKPSTVPTLFDQDSCCSMKENVHSHPVKLGVSSGDLVGDDCVEISDNESSVDAPVQSFHEEVIDSDDMSNKHVLDSDVSLPEPEKNDYAATLSPEHKDRVVHVQLSKEPCKSSPFQQNSIKNGFVKEDIANAALNSRVQKISSLASVAQVTTQDLAVHYVSKPKTRPNKNLELTSVKELRQELKDNQHAELSEALANHSFVGCIDNECALFQHQTWLYSINFVSVSESYFYQCYLLQFGQFAVLDLENPLRISDIVDIVVDDKVKAAAIVKLFKSKAAMFEDYFGIKISDGEYLKTLPNMLQDYLPDLSGLPLFFLRLGTEVCWAEEKKCFKQFGQALASFYALSPPCHPTLSSENESNKITTTPRSTRDQDPEYKRIVEHILFPALRRKFLAPTKLVTDKCVVQVASLPELYKVFERC